MSRVFGLGMPKASFRELLVLHLHPSISPGYPETSEAPRHQSYSIRAREANQPGIHRIQFMFTLQIGIKKKHSRLT